MEISQHWRLKKARYNLVGSECACGHKSFPAREVCPVCGAHMSEPARAETPAPAMAVATVGVLDRAAR
ncbi:MAG: zinc ribbon domain-containing protein [Anaerolineae bacterium]|nr:zinc ribbon domain-containing protein [Anaerolineae bacterium]